MWWMVSLILSATSDAGVNRPEIMQRALHGLIELQPVLATQNEFKRALNSEQVAEALAALGQVEHSFLDESPGPRGIAHALTLQVRRARIAVGTGDSEIARGVLRGVSSLCFSCHSLSPAAQSAHLDSKVPAFAMSPFERASFLAATRKFDEALSLWLQTLASPDDAIDRAERLNALRQAITVAVRVKNDPAQVTALMLAYERSGSATSHSGRWLTAWRAENRAWSAEGFDVGKASALQLFTRGHALVVSSHAAEHVLGDEGKTISLLRATSYLNLAIDRAPSAPWRGEALYGLGIATSALRDPLLWDLETVYFEACIRENARTSLSRRCFDALSDRVVFGFTGSSGTHVPPDVEERLRTLKLLAGPVIAPNR